MKKNAFSYIELIFAMILIIALMAMSGPLISKRAKKSNNVYGIYKCWVVNESGSPVYYEQSGYNTDSLSEAKKVKKCEFSKPTNASTFKVTLIGGGGGGTRATLASAPYVLKTLNEPDTETAFTGSRTFQDKNANRNLTVALSDDNKYKGTFSNDNTSFYLTGYKEITKVDAIKIIPGKGGNAGSIVKLTIPADSMPFKSGKISIEAGGSSATLKIGTIYLGTPTNTIKGAGTRSGMLITNAKKLKLPGACTSSGTSSKCYAAGGTAINDTNEKDYQIIATNTGYNYTYINGQNGKYDSTIATEETTGKGNSITCTNAPTKKCLTPQPATGVGCGGAGAGYATNNAKNSSYKFQEYTIVKLYSYNFPLGEYYDLYTNGSKNSTDPTFQSVSDNGYNGTSGYSGGGGIIIEW